MDVNKANIFNRSTVLAYLLLLFISPHTLAQEWIYTVVKGDTLSEFSQKHLYKTSYWKQLQIINNVADPKRIPENTKLRIPIAWIKSQPSSAEIMNITGSATVYHKGKPNSQKATKNLKLNLGDQLETGPQSSVRIRFADNSEIVVLQNSTVNFNHMTQYGDTGMVDSRIRLMSGDVETRAKTQKGNAARFEIHTPAAISAVRGTHFRTSYSANNDSAHVEVLEGGVAVKGGRTTRLIRSGFGTRIKKDSAPLKPKKLLQAPQLLPYPTPIELVGSQIQWATIKEAASYRFLISESDQFNTVLWDSSSDRSAISLPDLNDGTYYLALRAVDRYGIEGFETTQAFTLNAHPQPPFPVAPNDLAVIRGATPLLEWTHSSEASRYHIEVSTAATFKTTILTASNLTETTFNASELTASNTYYWRVASIAEDNEQGPFSPTRAIVIKPLPTVPEPALKEADNEIKLSWGRGLDNEAYQIQIARDRSFTTIITETTLFEPEITIPRPEGYRYIRVRSLADDGFEGAWGVTQELTPSPSESWIYIYGSFLLTILAL